uniref:TFR_dimer domain-containing protein n=1 Tax=Gongylonema pulchrum TaxID=637853 RepID=A0A183E7C9_9BILA
LYWKSAHFFFYFTPFRIKSPNKLEVKAERKTLLDSWRFYDPKGPIPGDRSIPGIGMPGSGSDFQRFITYLGIPVIDMKLESAPIYTYMLYHTMYEIPWFLDNFVDENYDALSAVGQLWLEIGRDLADSLIIPFNLHDYGLALADFISKMDQQLEHIGIPNAIGFRAYRLVLSNLRGALKRFQVVADVVQEIIQHVEQAFIAEQGIYDERPEYRHLIFSSSSYNEYGNFPFAGILDPALNWRNAFVAGDSQKADYWLKIVRIGFSKLHYAIESATLTITMDGFYD